MALELDTAGAISGPLAAEGHAGALLAILQQLPISGVFILVGLVLVVSCLFFCYCALGEDGFITEMNMSEEEKNVVQLSEFMQADGPPTLIFFRQAREAYSEDGELIESSGGAYAPAMCHSEATGPMAQP